MRDDTLSTVWKLLFTLGIIGLVIFCFLTLILTHIGDILNFLGIGIEFKITH